MRILHIFESVASVKSGPSKQSQSFYRPSSRLDAIASRLETVARLEAIPFTMCLT